MRQPGASTLVHATTRFIPPRLRNEIVPRSALAARVLSPDARLVVVSGPAGSGKSTLLAQAHATCPDPVWLSIEPSDDDPAVLWSALIDSTATTFPGFGDSYRHRLDTGGAEAVDGIIARFVNELAGLARPIRFFLDDLHHISGERSIGTLDQLFHQLPPGSCLVIASRCAAPFALGRLRIERAVVEIGPNDLTMDLDEARATLSSAGIDACDEQVAALVSRTEGWAAGLSWATLAMQQRPDSTSFVDMVDGLDGDLTAYLVEEVLDQRSPELQAFMLDTSILPRFNAALCDHMRGRADSRELIAELDRSNSFVVHLDRDDEWFRYHHLVHDVLADRLQRESPAAVPALHRRASSWHHEHDLIADSIRHARAAGDDRDAADILCAHWWEMMNAGRIETVHALFEEFGAAEICAYQPLSIAAAVLYSLAGDHRSAQVFARAAERGHYEGAPPDGSASIESALAIMRGSLVFDGVDAALAAAQRADELEPKGSKWSQLALLIMALCHVWRGEHELAEPMLEVFPASDESGDAVIVYAQAELALVRLGRGDLEGASSAAGAACALAEETGLERVFVAALARGAAAAVEIAAGDIRAADRHLDKAQAPMAAVSTAMPIDAMRTRIVLADVALQLGRTTEARTYIDAAARTAHRYRDTGALAEQLVAVAERLDDTEEQGPIELSDREREVLALMPTEMTVREIAEALFVSKETVKTHRRRIYRKLSVTSREDAVVAARVAGLLPETDDDDATPAQPET